MKRFWLFVLCFATILILFDANAQISRYQQPKVPVKKFGNINLKSAPVQEILSYYTCEQSQSLEWLTKKKICFDKKALERYRAGIVNSYSLLPKELDKLLQNEYTEINNETKRMTAAKNYYAKASKAYRYTNFKLSEQISEDMVNLRKLYAERKKKFNEIINSEPKDKPLFIIISNDTLFWGYDLGFGKYNQNKISELKTKENPIVCVFNHEYKILYSYPQRHFNVLSSKKISAVKTTKPQIDQIFQKMFDEYILDMRRIGGGLDVVNPTLLRQLSEMTDDWHKE